MKMTPLQVLVRFVVVSSQLVLNLNNKNQNFYITLVLHDPKKNEYAEIIYHHEFVDDVLEKLDFYLAKKYSPLCVELSTIDHGTIIGSNYFTLEPSQEEYALTNYRLLDKTNITHNSLIN